MSNSKKTSIFSIISLIVAAAMLIGVKFIVPVCTGMVEMASGTQTFMKCHYTSVAVGFFAIILIVNAAAALFTKEAAGAGIVAVVVSVLVFLVFQDNIGIGICAKPEMACHVTAPVIRLMAVLEALSGIAMTVVSVKKEVDKR